jgi:hypothetical protein
MKGIAKDITVILALWLFVTGGLWLLVNFLALAFTYGK